MHDSKHWHYGENYVWPSVENIGGSFYEHPTRTIVTKWATDLLPSEIDKCPVDPYDEEKENADKAPVDGISISDLSINNKKKDEIKEIRKFNYIIKIADFYYKKTAIMMQKRIKEELNLKNSKISELSNTNYRVYLGPFKNLKSLKKAFDGITPLNFENIEILKL